jgi:hypothetical protein
MKAFAVLILLGVSVAASAAPVAFERNYTNNAWGHISNGCIIDEQRFVYIYAAGSDKPITMINRMPESVFRKAKRLLHVAADSGYETRRVAADSGLATWVGQIDGRIVRIKEFGDTVGGRACQETEQLVELIEAFCPKFIGQ